MNFLQRLFVQPPAAGAVETPQLGWGLHVGKMTDVGLQRERNEDSLYTIEGIIEDDNGVEPFGLFIIADGMGGHEQGEKASSLAARIAAHHILQDVYLPYLSNDPAANRPINEVLVSAVEEANRVVRLDVPDGGTTLTVALVMGNSAYLAHVGDCRAYRFKEGTLKQITTDHSLAQRLGELGQATAEEMAQVQNVLYKAIGQNDKVEVDTYFQPLPPGSSLLLCSDGLWGQIPAEQMQAILNATSLPQPACEELVTTANQNGGPDNITVILVTMGLEK